ncbi:hypothetical protein Tco_0508128, partial [Tanacetum coccineum]
LAMSSDNPSSAVTYTSISSYSNGLSWGIPLVNAGELPEMDPYEEVAQQGQTPPLSPAYVPDPMELDEHVSVYVPEPEHPEYHVPTDDDIQVEDQPYVDDDSPTAESPGHIAGSELVEEDLLTIQMSLRMTMRIRRKIPRRTILTTLLMERMEPIEDDEEEEHLALADSSAIPIVDLVPSDGDTEAFETDESAPTPRSPQTRVPFSQTCLRMARKTIKLKPPMSAFIEARISEHAATPIPPTSPVYDQEPLGHRAAMIRMRDDIPKEDMPPRRRFVLTAPPLGCDVAESSAAAARLPRGQYDFVDTIEAGQGLIHSPGHDTRTIARAADRAKDVGYVRALQAYEHRMMTSIKEVNLRVSYQAQIDVVRGQRTAYETELHEVRQAYLSSEARNRALLARLETLETHMSRMEWQRQSAEDLAVRQMMRIHVLEARAQIDTMEDTGSSNDASQSSGGGLRRLVQPARIEKIESVFYISGCAIDCQVKFATCTLLRAALTWWNGHVRGNDVAAYTQCFQELALMCTKFLADETKKVDKYISGLPDNIHGNVMSVRPKTLDDAIELANDLMDQKLRTYAERQNDSKRKADDSSRNN